MKADIQQFVRLVSIVLLLVNLFSCTEDPSEKSDNDKTKKLTEPVKKLVPVPEFNEDSAYKYIEKQVNFGPRVPNSLEHKACGDYILSQLKEFGWTVSEQKANLTAYNGTILNARNLMARWDTSNSQRIVLFAHWDTRPYADRDKKNRNKPIDGANDGGSGVGVIMEIARTIGISEKPAVGVDIVFFDAEDYGQPQETMIQSQSNTWCLGSQYWSANIPFKNYHPRYGILLDMVGAENAIFPKEGVSMKFAPQVVEKVWQTATRLGYSNYFRNIESFELTDDHRYVNMIARIPTIDIIHYDHYRSDFGTFHHTHQDNLEIIKKEPLKAVGQTVLDVIYQEK